MTPGLLGKKIGMTQVFEEDGRRVSITLLKAGPCAVQDIKTVERDGYNAVKLGFDDVKEKNVKKPMMEYLRSKKLKPKRFVREIRYSETPDVKIGDQITNSIFQKGDFLDITGRSKGKGFQGGMRRCGWTGGVESHGSMSHRAPGSIGASSFPSRVVKGHGMPGHMGDEKITVQNLEVIDVDNENSTIAVRGAVPGSNGSYVIIRYALKKEIAPRPEKTEPADQGQGESKEQDKD